MALDNTIFPTETEIPEQFRFNKPIEQRAYLVDGELKTWTGPQQDVLSPICIRDPKTNALAQKRLGSYPLMTGDEAKNILAAAVKAYDHGRGVWPTMSMGERVKHFEMFIDKISEAKDEVVKFTMWEIGKTYKDAVKEFDRTVEYIHGTIKAVKELSQKEATLEMTEGIMAQIKRSSLGTVLCMGPFNYPLNETYTTLIPALIMGNTAVLKPAKYGVLLHEPLLKAYKESFPPGVINTVYGDGPTIIGPMIKSGDVDVLAFIGTSKVADILKKQHPGPRPMKAVLGMDAKNPFVVFADADLENAVEEGIQSAFGFNAQRCTAGKIMIIEESVADRFIKMFAERVDRLVLGMPWGKDVMITPLPEENKTLKMMEYVQDAIKHGGRVANKTGAQSVGTLFTPTVVTGVTKDMRLYHEEQFGPVIPIMTFKDPSEVQDYIINSKFGQQISIFSNDTERIKDMLRYLPVQLSRININSQCQRGPDTYPFTGRKNSAEGTLSVSDALRVFSIRTMVAGKMTERNKEIFHTIMNDPESTFLSNDYIF